MLVRALGLTPTAGASSFTDVSDSAWYASSVATAVEAGLINGFEDGSFRPAANITREQIAVMIVKAINFAGVTIPESALDEQGVVWICRQYSSSKLGEISTSSKCEYWDYFR